MAPLNVCVLALLLLCGKSVFGELNVYDKQMTACGSNNPDGCSYMSFDLGAHEICVGSLPAGFSSATGQGPWSDEFTGQPWCICIWAYSNYILHHRDLGIECKSIPSKVLESRYSLDKFAQCGAMSSTEGCGPEDIRRSIQSLCQQCDAQAGADQAAKQALKAKCDAILHTAPAVDMRLQSIDGNFHIWASSDWAFFAFGSLAFASAVVLMGIIFRRFWTEEQAGSYAVLLA